MPNISFSFCLNCSLFCSSSIIVCLSISNSFIVKDAFSLASLSSFLAFSKFVVNVVNLSFIRFLFFSINFTSLSSSFLLLIASFLSAKADFSLSLDSRVCCSNSIISFSKLFFSPTVLSYDALTESYDSSALTVSGFSNLSFLSASTAFVSASSLIVLSEPISLVILSLRRMSFSCLPRKSSISFSRLFFAERSSCSSFSAILALFSTSEVAILAVFSFDSKEPLSVLTL